MRKLFNIKRGEERRLLYFVAVYFLLLSGIVMGSSAITSLFLKRFGVQFLPAMFIVVAITTILLNSPYDRASALFSKENYFVALAVFCSALVLTLRVLCATNARIVFAAMFVSVEVVSFLLFSQFWTVALNYFDTLESKRLFPLIATGGSLGGMAGGLATKSLVSIMPSLDMLFVWSGLLLLCAPAMLLLKRGCEQKGLSQRKPKPRTKGPKPVSFTARARDELAAHWNSPMTRALILLTVLGTFVSFILDFQANKVFSDNIKSEDALTSFLGVFSSVSFVASIIIQGLLLSRIIQKLGVTNTNFVFPIASLASSSLLLISPGFVAGALGYFTRRYLRASFYAVVYDMLFNSLNEKVKTKARTFMKGNITALATLAISLVILFVNTFFSTACFAILSALGFAIGVVFVLLCAKMRHIYVESLMDVLSSGKIDFSSTMTGWSTSFQGGIVIRKAAQVLIEADDDLSMILLETFKDMKPESEVSAALRNAFGAKSPAVKKRIIEMLGETEASENKAFLVKEYDASPLDVKESILRALSNAPGADAAELAMRELKNPGAEKGLKKESAALLCRSDDIYYISEAIYFLRKMMESADRTEVFEGVEAIANLKSSAFIPLLYEYYQSFESPEFKLMILESMSAMEPGVSDRNLRMFTEIYEAGGQDEKRLCMRALMKIDSPATVRRFEEGFEDFPVEHKLLFLREYEASANKAPGFLLRLLEDERQTREVFDAVADMLGRGVLRPKIRKRDIRAAFDARARQTTRTAAQILSLDQLGGDAEILLMSLRERLDNCAHAAVVAAALHSKKLEKMGDILFNLSSGDKLLMANAMETMSNICDKKMCALLEPVIMMGKDSSRMAEFIKSQHAEVPAPSETLREILESKDNWLAACGLYVLSLPGARPHRGGDIEKLIENAAGSGDEYIKEAALLAAR